MNVPFRHFNISTFRHSKLEIEIGRRDSRRSFFPVADMLHELHPEPSAADLDVRAEEEKVKEATAR